MAAKYAKGQKVRIVSLEDDHLKAKHPHIEEYVCLRLAWSSNLTGMVFANLIGLVADVLI